MTMSLIATGTVSSGAIEFTSIPQDGTDLLLVYSLRSDRNNITDTVLAQVNGSNSGYTMRFLTGDGATATSTSSSLTYFTWGNMPGALSTSNTFGNGATYIPNYTSSTAKSTSTDIVQENNATTSYQNLNAASWSGTAAITSIVVAALGGLLVSGSTASLYKITKGSDGIVTTS